MCLCEYMLHACKCRKRAVDPLELDSEAIMDQLTWGLGPELGSSGSSASGLNCWAISPSPQYDLMARTERCLFTQNILTEPLLYAKLASIYKITNSHMCGRSVDSVWGMECGCRGRQTGFLYPARLPRTMTWKEHCLIHNSSTATEVRDRYSVQPTLELGWRWSL